MEAQAPASKARGEGKKLFFGNKKGFYFCDFCIENTKITQQTKTTRIISENQVLLKHFLNRMF